MKIFKLNLISLRNNPLNISIFLSLFIHIFIINILYKNPISNTKGDKYILGRKQIDIALKKLDQERRALLKARDQGGVIAVEADGVLITAYRFDSFNRKLAQL